MARFREFRRDSCCRDSCEISRGSEVRVVRGFGTVNSTGVLPSRQNSPTFTNEVEFSINISRIGRCYQGEVYIVDYDTREKISSNKLVFFEQFNEIQIVTIFMVESGSRNCNFEMVVSLSPTNCTANANGKFFAYIPPILNQGLNIGGNLRTGEIKVCGHSCCHDHGCHSCHSGHSSHCCNNAFALNGIIVDDDFEEDDCVFFSTSNSPNSCCSGRNRNRNIDDDDNRNRNRNINDNDNFNQNRNINDNINRNRNDNDNRNINDNENVNRNRNINDNTNINRNVNTNINTNINNNINNNINDNRNNTRNDNRNDNDRADNRMTNHTKNRRN